VRLPPTNWFAPPSSNAEARAERVLGLLANTLKCTSMLPEQISRRSFEAKWRNFVISVVRLEISLRRSRFCQMNRAIRYVDSTLAWIIFACGVAGIVSILLPFHMLFRSLDTPLLWLFVAMFQPVAGA
jgi:uncharacterized membrane protein YbhN (UPF0104 family)